MWNVARDKEISRGIEKYNEQESGTYWKRVRIRS
jgi:hypothetical protein